MRSLRTILGIASLFAAVFAASNLSQCMSQADAQQVADNWQNLQAEYSIALAQASLTMDFISYSDSISTVINDGCAGPRPLGVATFDSRAALEVGQSSQELMSFQQLNLWYTCKEVFLRWRFQPFEVTGITAMETIQAQDGAIFPWLITTVYWKFNSGCSIPERLGVSSKCMRQGFAAEKLA